MPHFQEVYLVKSHLILFNLLMYNSNSQLNKMSYGSLLESELLTSHKPSQANPMAFTIPTYADSSEFKEFLGEVNARENFHTGYIFIILD